MTRPVLEVLRPPSVLLGLLPLVLIAFTHLTPTLPSQTGDELLDGDVLIGEAGCVNCHSVGARAPEWIDPLEAPSLAGVGRRVTPQYLRRYLDDPRDAHPGTRMPDVLAGLTSWEREQAIEELLHYLVSLGGPADQSAVAADPSAARLGSRLFHTVGCVACHGAMEPPEGETAVPDGVPVRKALPELAWKTTLPELAAFLLDPRMDRPAGRMPSLKLTEEEAHRIAAYLLRGQDVDEQGNPRPPSRFPGLRYEYYEATIDASEPDFHEHEPVREGVAPNFTVDLPRRDDHFGFVFEGTVTIPLGGDWEFSTESDDGSRLAIDGEYVVKNDGTHPMQERSGTVHLTAGDHAIQVTIFEHGGGEGLIVRWQGPGVDKQEIPDEVLSHESRSLGPLHAEDFRVDAARVAQGRARFQALGCSACHATDQPSGHTGSAPPLAAVDPETGCLAATPAAGLPRYAFDQVQHSAIVAALTRSDRWRDPPAAHETLERSLTALKCDACHQRGDAGGPTESNNRYFTMATDADIGDEGRVPPPLHDVGRKLRPEWLREVLADGASVRPYMTTRMPQFGEENAARLVELFPRADRGHERVAEPSFQLELLEAGRTLIGLKGLSCINCHSFQGHASLGMPGPDLTSVHRRIEYPWFHDFLFKPSNLRPGTRMPSFYEEALADLDILDRDKTRQVEAMWVYLSLAGSAPLPHGIKVDADTYEVVPVETPRLVGVFMKDMSAKVVAVGFPERAHYAWDSVHLRLGKVWRGDFLNAKGTWHGRAGALEVPPGDDVIDLPPHSPFAILEDPGQAWPTETGPAAGQKKLGLRYDTERRPVHRFTVGPVTVEEKPYPVLRQGGAWMIREFRIHAPTRPRGLTFRAAVGDTIQSSGEVWQVDGLRLRFTGDVEPYLRNTGDRPELLVPLDEAGQGGRGSWMLDFQVEMSW